MPSRAAFLPGIVPLEIFSTAFSWQTSGFEISSMTGPAIGGLLIGWFQSPTLVYTINATGQFIFVMLLAGIAYKNPTGAKQPLTFSSFSAGFRYVWKVKVVLSAIALDMFGVLLGGATAMMPIYAKDILHVGPRGLGWLMAAPSIGAFSMAMIQAHRGPLRKKPRRIERGFSLGCAQRCGNGAA